MCRCGRSLLLLLLRVALGRPGGLFFLLGFLPPFTEDVFPQGLGRHTARPGYMASNVSQGRLALCRRRPWASPITGGGCCLQFFV